MSVSTAPRASVLASVLALGLALSFGSAALADPVVKIGFLGPMTGPFADSGARPRNTLQLLADEINAGGGIALKNGQKAKIELVVGDDQGTVDAGGNETRRMSEGAGVHVILGGMLSSPTLAEIDIAEGLKTPFVVSGAVAYAIGTKIAERNYRYIYQATPTSVQRADADLNAVIDLIKPKTVYVLSQDTDWGREVVGATAAKFKSMEGNYKVVEEFVRPGNTDYSAITLKIQQLKPDLIYAVINGSELMSFMEQRNDAGIKAPVFGAASSATSKVFIETLGKDVALGTLANLVWVPQIGGKVAADFAKKYSERFNAPASDLEAQTYDAFQLTVNAIANADAVSREAIADALAKARIDGLRGPDQSFDPQRHGIKNLQFVIGQLQKGGYKVVWPPEHAEAKYQP